MASSEDLHNAAVLKSLEVGDLVEFPGLLYSHWGVYIGDNQIVHLTRVGDAGSKGALTWDSLFAICGKTFSKASVEKEDFLTVAKGYKAKRNNDKHSKHKPLPPAEIVKRALEKVGVTGYNIIWNNCEHFATYVRYGEATSDQIIGILKTASLTIQQVVMKGLVGEQPRTLTFWEKIF